MWRDNKNSVALEPRAVPVNKDTGRGLGWVGENGAEMEDTMAVGGAAKGE